MHGDSGTGGREMNTTGGLPSQPRSRQNSTAKRSHPATGIKEKHKTRDEQQERKHLHDKDLFDLALVKLVPAQIHGIPDLTLGRSYLLIQQHQPLSAIDTSVRQDNGVVLDVALAVVGVGHVSREFVEFGAADWTD